EVLSGGISQALIATVAGLTVAIIAYIPYRYLRGKVDDLVVRMERETTRLMNAVREADHVQEPEHPAKPRKIREARA
ncbi:MAG TPA: MotA/TolQ/ExbB proton channel family protein, partial [Gammaproteobacteria bacterium]|nr:MotA/TolQ/ExbB proton channel family protein [Gammaproteobacteria bacterium]